MKHIDGYTLTKKNYTTTIARQDGTVIGSAFRMPGDRRWMVSATDFRGRSFPLYFDTMALVIQHFEAKAAQ